VGGRGKEVAEEQVGEVGGGLVMDSRDVVVMWSREREWLSGRAADFWMYWSLDVCR